MDENISIKTRHYTMGIYKIQGIRILVAGIYGPSCSSDTIATEIYRQFSLDYDNMIRVGQTTYTVIAGDFNLHLDTCQPKPKACKLMVDFIAHSNLCDTGREGRKATWRRPHRNTNKSRIDYIMHTDNIKAQTLQHSWS